jgi:hypothetical protein
MFSPPGWAFDVAIGVGSVALCVYLLHLIVRGLRRGTPPPPLRDSARYLYAVAAVELLVALVLATTRAGHAISIMCDVALSVGLVLWAWTYQQGPYVSRAVRVLRLRVLTRMLERRQAQLR